MVDWLNAWWRWVMIGSCLILPRRVQDGIQPLVPNSMQADIYETMLTQAMADRPIRIVGLKMRKGGFSTLVQSAGYSLCKSVAHFHAQTVAHTDASTKDIALIGKRMYVNDPDWGSRPKEPTESAISLADHNGSKFATRTFGGHYVSSSATIHFLHISELAKAPGDPRFVSDQLLSLFGAVPDEASTVILIESTANEADRSGEYERRFWEAREEKGDFIAVFYPWYLEDSYATPGPALRPLADRKLRMAEDDLRDQFPFLTDDQLRWRRNKVVQLGGLRKFMQEYPSSPEEAFQKAEGKVFPSLRREVHHYSVEVRELLKRGYRLYRGFDWGGRDPFVSIWVAHNPREHGRFTVDIERCPKLWYELTRHCYDENGRPIDRDNHGIDALRYATTFWDMKGHVHVFQELFDFDFAGEGKWIQDCAHAVLDASADLPITGSVGDRGRPDCITAFNAQRLPTSKYLVEGVSGRPGEIMYGIDRLNQLMTANYPLTYPPEPPSEFEQRARQKASTGMTYGFRNLNQLDAQKQWEETRQGNAPVGVGAWKGI